MTSTTGVSAHALGPGASTLHRWSSIKLGDKPFDVILSWIRQNQDKKRRWKKAQILVIDEVSMLGASVLTLVSKIGQMIRLGLKEIKRLQKEKLEIPPFGGIQVIFSGDFMQLMPVNDEFAFKSTVWKQLNFFNFRCTHPYRYKDIDHFNLLSRIRVGEHTEKDIEILRSRVKAYEEYKKQEKSFQLKGKIKPTRIYPLKKDVEAINNVELERLEGDAICYSAEDTISIKVNVDGKQAEDPENLNTQEYVEYMDTIVPPEITLKPGAQVMLTTN